MRTHGIESQSRDMIARVEAGQSVEDQRIELKAD